MKINFSILLLLTKTHIWSDFHGESIGKELLNIIFHIEVHDFHQMKESETSFKVDTQKKYSVFAVLLCGKWKLKRGKEKP